MDFDFGTEEKYVEPEVKEMVPFMNTSGYVKGALTVFKFNASYNSIDIEITGTLGGKPVIANYLNLYMENKDGTRADGYYHFMAICKILGIDKPIKNEFTGEFTNLIKKEIVMGIQCTFDQGAAYPKKYIQSIHDAVTGQTITEKTSGAKAEKIHTPIKDYFKKNKNGTELTGAQPAPANSGDFAYGEAPAGFEESELPF